jgi:hypothetical protein
MVTLDRNATACFQFPKLGDVSAEVRGPPVAEATILPLQPTRWTAQQLCDALAAIGMPASLRTIQAWCRGRVVITSARWYRGAWRISHTEIATRWPRLLEHRPIVLVEPRAA